MTEHVSPEVRALHKGYFEIVWNTIPKQMI